MLTITIEEIKEIIKESPLIELYELKNNEVDKIATELYNLYILRSHEN